MAVDRAWVQRNLGFDPIANPPPANTFTFAKAATSSKPEDFQREIIDFDSEAPSGREFLAFTTATGLSRYVDVKWPKGLAPTPAKSINRGSADPLPAADVLVVTWTVDEGHALSRVLTPGKDTHNDYLPYTNNFAAISKRMRPGCPALEAKRLGAYPSRWSTERSAQWCPLKPKLVVEVAYDHFSGERFRHGTSILRWRPDKATRQCTFDQLKQKTADPMKLLA